MQLRRPLSDWAMLFVLVITWGSSFGLNKIALGAMPPLILVACRLSVAAVTLLGVCIAQQQTLRLPWRQWGFFVALAIVGNCIPFFLISWGQLKIDSGLAGILMAIIPLLTLLLAHFVIATERIDRSKLSGFIVGFGGIVLLVGPDAIRNIGGSSVIAQLAVLGGAVCFAVNVVMTPFNRVNNVLVTATGTLLISALIMLPLALSLHPPASLDLTTDAVIAAILLGIFATALPQLVFFRLVASAGPTFYSLINYLIPVWAMLAGALFLQERPEWNAYLALVLILSGVGISQLRKTSRQSAGT